MFTERALPAVVPVTFALHADGIVMRTFGYTSLAAAAARGGVLAFELDHIDPASRTGWSVVVLGEPELVTNAEERARINLVLEPWAPGHHDVCIRLPLTVVTGRRIASSGSAPATSAVSPSPHARYEPDPGARARQLQQEPQPVTTPRTAAARRPPPPRTTQPTGLGQPQAGLGTSTGSLRPWLKD